LKNFPNYLSILRVLLVPIIFIYLAYYNRLHPHFRDIALALFVLAAFTDALDGFLARRFRVQTELGAFLDPFADKLLLLSTYFAILLSPGLDIKPPLWVVIVIVFRDLLIVCGFAIIFITTKHVRSKPNIIGKLTTTFQMATVISILMQWRYSPIIWYTTALLTILSGLVYVVREVKLLNKLSPLIPKY
jgi:cardiolipin synthase